jgi:hypothetical protein
MSRAAAHAGAAAGAAEAMHAPTLPLACRQCCRGWCGWHSREGEFAQEPAQLVKDAADEQLALQGHILQQT